MSEEINNGEGPAASGQDGEELSEAGADTPPETIAETATEKPAETEAPAVETDPTLQEEAAAPQEVGGVVADAAAEEDANAFVQVRIPRPSQPPTGYAPAHLDVSLTGKQAETLRYVREGLREAGAGDIDSSDAVRRLLDMIARQLEL